MHRLDRRIRDDALRISLGVLGPNHHDGQLHLKRHPLLSIARQAAKLAQRLLHVRLAGDLEVPAAVVGPLARLEHPRKPKLARRRLHPRAHALVALGERQLLRHGTPLPREVVLLRELVLDEPQGAPGRVDRDGFLVVARFVGDAERGDFLQHVRLDVLDLDRQHVAAGGEGAYLGWVFEGAGDVGLVAVDLLGGAVGLVQDGDGYIEGRGSFAEHTA